jgi:hypothetical protein
VVTERGQTEGRTATVVEGENMQSVKKNRRTLVEQWWNSSSGDMEQQRVVNKWSGGLKPTVFHEAFQVNSEDAVEGVGEGTGRLTCVGIVNIHSV